MIDCHWYHNDITAYLYCNIANFGVLLNPYASWMNKVDPWSWSRENWERIQNQMVQMAKYKETFKKQRKWLVHSELWQHYNYYLHSLNFMGTVVLNYHSYPTNTTEKQTSNKRFNSFFLSYQHQHLTSYQHSSSIHGVMISFFIHWYWETVFVLFRKTWKHSEKIQTTGMREAQKAFRFVTCFDQSKII